MWCGVVVSGLKPDTNTLTHGEEGGGEERVIQEVLKGCQVCQRSSTGKLSKFTKTVLCRN